MRTCCKHHRHIQNDIPNVNKETCGWRNHPLNQTFSTLFWNMTFCHFTCSWIKVSFKGYGQPKTQNKKTQHCWCLLGMRKEKEQWKIWKGWVEEGPKKFTHLSSVYPTSLLWHLMLRKLVLVKGIHKQSRLNESGARKKCLYYFLCNLLMSFHKNSWRSHPSITKINELQV